ncbi:RNase adapter RapZ [Peptoniphilus sp. KCTC 25270]|uniref:RNase adapter RapZ n=1 Tax=Peptoniphilus sp. KCTC 25270 TaxID=2897414 RepID=UPI001E5A5F56|nr:RNase adapter RapZ [Peptoniphilus sp. KCTC 25270]MCD1146718.1 RNase adapter RapZ [Peptoniphilus sp. KCTC 25270]
MKLLIISGLSGAGKSQALKAAEDMGYYCVDNLPPKLMTKFVEIAKEAKMPLVALVSDIRSREFFQEIELALQELQDRTDEMKVVFLEADDAVLIKRYKELRRPHPLNDSIQRGIKEERVIMSALRSRADYIIDTSKLNNYSLRLKLKTIVNQEEDRFQLSIISFGFKNGILAEADLVFDVRFLPNPYYIEELKPKNGLSEEIQNFIFRWDQANIFVEKYVDLVKTMAPFYATEGKNHITIGIGCTGGYHRSVAIAETLGEAFREKDFLVEVDHRDLR